MAPETETIRARISTVEEHLRSENLHDLEAIMQTFGPEAQYEDEAWGEHHKGRAGVQSYYEGLVRALPDLRIDVNRKHVAEENIILEVEISGTHKGPWKGLPGTGRRVRFPLCAVYSFDEQNKLAGERIYYDRATVLGQVGLFHEPVSWLGRLTAPLIHPLTIGKAFGRMLFGPRPKE